MKRRSFLRTATAATAALTIFPTACISNKQRKTGLILYTLREEMNANALETLDKVASLGYNWLEAADYRYGRFYGMAPADFRQAVEERGMELISSHVPLYPDNADQIIGAASEAGLKYLILPSLPGEWNKTIDGFKEAAEFMNKVGENCKAKGIKFGFHNHTNEFSPIDGLIPYDVLLKNTDPDLVTFQLDLAWITGGGHRPEKYMEQYPGRFELWHVKDLSPEGGDATLGEGIIDFASIFEYKKISGMKYFFIEQDNCKTHSPLESVKISRDYLLGLDI